MIEAIQQKKAEIDNFKFEAEQAERQGDYGRVAELRYGKVKEAEAAIEKLQKEFEEIRITSYNVCYTKLLRKQLSVKTIRKNFPV